MNLREDKGYTYGVRRASTCAAATALRPANQRRHGGDGLGARRGVQRAREIRDGRPVTADELLAKSSVTLGYPRGFETVQQIARAVAQLALHDLPDSFEEFVPRIEAVTLGEVAAAARRYLDPDRMTTVIVGDEDRVSETLSVRTGPAQTVTPPIRVHAHSSQFDEGRSLSCAWRAGGAALRGRA